MSDSHFLEEYELNWWNSIKALREYLQQLNKHRISLEADHKKKVEDKARELEDDLRKDTSWDQDDPFGKYDGSDDFCNWEFVKDEYLNNVYGAFSVCCASRIESLDSDLVKNLRETKQGLCRLWKAEPKAFDDDNSVKTIKLLANSFKHDGGILKKPKQKVQKTDPMHRDKTNREDLSTELLKLGVKGRDGDGIIEFEHLNWSAYLDGIDAFGTKLLKHFKKFKSSNKS